MWLSALGSSAKELRTGTVPVRSWYPTPQLEAEDGSELRAEVFPLTIGTALE